MCMRVCVCVHVRVCLCACWGEGRQQGNDLSSPLGPSRSGPSGRAEGLLQFVITRPLYYIRKQAQLLAVAAMRPLAVLAG